MLVPLGGVVESLVTIFAQKSSSGIPDMRPKKTLEPYSNKCIVAIPYPTHCFATLKIAAALMF